MQNAGRKQKTTFAMAFLFVSLVITPLSLKAIGVSPNLSAGVDAWRRVASLFGDSHQPVNTAELLAFNTTPDDAQPDAATPFASTSLALVQPLDAQITAASAMSADAPVAGSVASPLPAIRRCARAAKPAQPATPAAPTAMNLVVPVEAISAEGTPATETIRVAVPISRAALLRSERQLAKCRFDLREVLKFAPKDLKVLINRNTPIRQAPPLITSCEFRKAFTPEKIKQIPFAGRSVSFEASSEAAENSEL